MSDHVIGSDEEYAAALLRIEALWGAEPGTPEGDELDRLLVAVCDYEDVYHQVE